MAAGEAIAEASVVVVGRPTAELDGGRAATAAAGALDSGMGVVGAAAAGAVAAA
jgi:hypothetical protein